VPGRRFIDRGVNVETETHIEPNRSTAPGQARFETDFRYTDRETKAKFVWLKYRPILTGRILDVGADECHLRAHLPEGADYTGIGLGGNPDLQVNLEKEPLPFPDGTFDCVLCLDVLEHLDNIHAVFDELCRVTRRHVIVSLPNAWADLYRALRVRDYRPGQATKFYGLPPEPPEDRHKWFCSAEEAEAFIRYRAERNGMAVIHLDDEGMGGEGRGLRGFLRRKARDVLFRSGLNVANLYRGTVWAVLEKRGRGEAP
jgi:SAM-dependent methyltransferase